VAPEINESTISNLSKIKMKRQLDNGIRSLLGLREPTPQERRHRKNQLKKKINKRNREIKKEMKLNEAIDKRTTAQVP
jgi:hypothetical protein